MNRPTFASPIAAAATLVVAGELSDAINALAEPVSRVAGVISSR